MTRRMKKLPRTLWLPHRYSGRLVYWDLMRWLSSCPEWKGLLGPEWYLEFWQDWQRSRFCGEPFPASSKNFIVRESVFTGLAVNRVPPRCLLPHSFEEMQKANICLFSFALLFSMCAGICWQTLSDSFRRICWSRLMLPRLWQPAAALP